VLREVSFKFRGRQSQPVLAQGRESLRLRQYVQTTKASGLNILTTHICSPDIIAGQLGIQVLAAGIFIQIEWLVP
jgi:hypothetical protein